MTVAGMPKCNAIDEHRQVLGSFIYFCITFCRHITTLFRDSFYLFCWSAENTAINPKLRRCTAVPIAQIFKNSEKSST